MLGLFLLLSGCQTPERAAIAPLPADTPSMSYKELTERAKRQVWAAYEFSCTDSWTEVEQAATSLQQTSGLLAKLRAEDVPDKQRPQFTRLVKELDEGAGALRDAGHAKDLKKTDEALNKLHITIRDLRQP
jgi:hypothetical protein